MDIWDMGAHNMLVDGYAMNVKMKCVALFLGTKNVNSDLSQKKQLSETLQYPNIPGSF